MDEFPSMYSRPLLSRSTAPCPSTRTSGSCSAAHHSRMSVNGCQTNRLSQAINWSVFHSIMEHHFALSFGAARPRRSLGEGGSAAINSLVFHSVMYQCVDPRFSILGEIRAQLGPISRIEHPASALQAFIHTRSVPGLASLLMLRPRLKRAAADIFAPGFLSMSASPPATADRSRSSQDRRLFWPGTAMHRRTSSRALRVFCHLDFCPSICVDSASR